MTRARRGGAGDPGLAGAAAPRLRRAARAARAPRRPRAAGAGHRRPAVGRRRQRRPARRAAAAARRAGRCSSSAATARRKRRRATLLSSLLPCATRRWRRRCAAGHRRSASWPRTKRGQLATRARSAAAHDARPRAGHRARVGRQSASSSTSWCASAAVSRRAARLDEVIRARVAELARAGARAARAGRGRRPPDRARSGAAHAAALEHERRVPRSPPCARRTSSARGAARAGTRSSPTTTACARPCSRGLEPEELRACTSGWRSALLASGRADPEPLADALPGGGRSAAGGATTP